MTIRRRLEKLEVADVAAHPNVRIVLMKDGVEEPVERPGEHLIIVNFINARKAA